MGKRNDTMAVVDSEGKVIGVEGLRIADASVFPFLPPGYPQSVVCNSVADDGVEVRADKL